MTTDTSPDSKCPICSNKLDNVARPDTCWHSFCFRCILDRSRITADCPVCTMPFNSIFHSIRADNDFQEYKVPPPEDYDSPYPSTSALTQSILNKYKNGLLDYKYLAPPRDEGSGSNSAVTDIPGSKPSSPVSAVGQSPWDDETPGPSSSILKEYGATAAPQKESTAKNYTWKRIKLQPRKCHSEHNLKRKRSRSRDGSKHRDEKRKKSRSHGMSPFQESHGGSGSHKNTAARDSSRPYHKGRGQSSQDNDHHNRGDSHCSKYKRDSPKTGRDSPSCRKRTYSEAHSSQKPTEPEFKSQAFTEGTDLQGQMGLHEGDDSNYRRCRSRSRSRSRSNSPSAEARRRREKPGGKRKCKTRHVEKTEKQNTSTEEKCGTDIPTSSDYYKYLCSLADYPVSWDGEPEEKRERRSPSVESL